MINKDGFIHKKRLVLLLSFVLILSVFFTNQETVHAAADDQYWGPDGYLIDPNKTEPYDFYNSIYNSGSRRLAGNTRVQTAEMIFNAYQQGNPNANSVVLYPGRDSLWMDSINAVPFAHGINAPMIALPLTYGAQIFDNQGSYHDGSKRVTVNNIRGSNGTIVSGDNLPNYKGGARNAVATLDVMASIGRLKNLQRIYIVGGNVPNGAISEETRLYLAQRFGVEVVSLMGSTLDTTAISVSRDVERVRSQRNGAILISRTESALFDGISVVTQAARLGYPIFYTNANGDGLNSSVRDRLNQYQKVYVIGGTSMVKETALSGITRPITRIDGTGRDTGTRNWGTDKYATNLEILEHFESSPSHLFTANGHILNSNSQESGLNMGSTSFSDTVAGSIVAAQQNAGILLLRSGEYSNPQLLSNQKTYLTDSTRYYYRMTFLGGPVSVASSLRTEIETLFGNTRATISQSALAADRTSATLTIGGDQSQSGIRDVRYRAVSGKALSAYGTGWRTGWTPSNDTWFTNPQRARSYSDSATQVRYNGQYEVEVRDRYNGNNTFTARINVTGIDDINPVASVSQTPTDWTNGSVALHVQATENAANDSGIAQIRHVSGGTVSGTRTYTHANVRSATSTFTATTNGTYNFEVTDRSGNKTVVSQTVTNIDKGRPDITVASNPNTVTNQNVALTIQARDYGELNGQSTAAHISGVAKLDVRRPDGTTWTYAYTSATQRVTAWQTQVFTATQNGNHVITVTDRAGNTHSVTQNVQIDRTNPTIDVSQTPTAWTNTDVRVNWVANAQGISDLSRARMHNGTAWEAWYDSPVRSRPFTAIVPTNATVQLQVQDQAGNNVVRSHTVTNIDKDAPEMTFSHSPTTWTNGNVTTTIRARDHGANGRISGVKRFRMRTANGTWGSWENYSSVTNEFELTTAWYSRTRTITQNGTYEVQVEDNAGNIKSDSFTVDWIDKALPTVTSTQNPTDWVNRYVDITWRIQQQGGSPIRSVRSYDGSAWSEWTNYNNATVFHNQRVTTNGTYRIQAKDQAGNIVESTHTVSNIDLGDPAITVTQTPTTWTNGSVSLKIDARDHGEQNGQNTSAYISGISTISVKRPNGTVWNDTYGAESGKSTLYYARTFTATENGTYVITVTDRAGNSKVVNHSVTNIDRAVPNGSTERQQGWTNGNVWIDVTGQANASGLSYIKYISGGNLTGNREFSFTGTTSSQKVRFTATENATYTFEIGDRAGNVRRVTQVVDNIDRTAARGTTTQNPTGWTNKPVNIVLSGNDLNGQGTRISGVDQVRMREAGASTWTDTRTVTDSTEFSPNFGALTFSVTKNGRYEFELRDRAGNSSVVSHTVSNIDVGDPAIRSSQSPTDWTNGNVILTMEARDFGEQNGQSTHISGIASISVKRPDGTMWNDTYGAESTGSQLYYGRGLTATQNGTYVITVTDRAGNSSVLNHTITNIDRSTPNGSTERQQGWTNGNVWVDVTGQANVSGLAYIRHISGGTITGNKEFTFTGVTSAQKVRFTATENATYTFEIGDRAGNTRRVTQVVDNIDRTAARGATTQNPTGWTNKPVNIVLSGEDLNNQNALASGVDRIRMREAGSTTWSETRTITDSTSQSPSVKPLTFTVAKNGRYEFELKDRAGNIAVVSHTVGNIDVGVPDIRVTQGSVGWTNWTNGNVVLTIDARDYGEQNGQSTHISGISTISIKRPDGTVWNDVYGQPSEGSTVYHSRSFTATTNGTYEITITDRAGNSTVYRHDVTVIDRSTPTGSTERQQGWTNGNVWIDVTGQDLVSGLSYIRYVSGGNLTGDTEFTFSGTTNAHKVRFMATTNATYTFEIGDRVGNTRRVTQVVDNIDRTAARGATKQTPDNWTNQNVNILLSGEDLNNEGNLVSGVDRVRTRKAGASSWAETRTITDSTSQSPNFNPLTFTVPENGRYEFELKDRAGNSALVSHTITNIDKLAPEASGTFTPNGWTNEEISITWTAKRTGNPGAPLEAFRYDRGNGNWTDWQPATNADQFNVVQKVSANNDYYFEVRDAAGNVGKATVKVTQYDNVIPTGNIAARYDRSEQDHHIGYTSKDAVNMVDSNTVTVDVTGVRDLGISGVKSITIEEQRRIGYNGNWATVKETAHNWPDPYTVKDQTYKLDVAHALDTRFVLTVYDRAGNKSKSVTSNMVRQSVLQFVDFKITDVVNPQLTPEEIEAIRDTDLTSEPVQMTAGTNATFDFTYQLRHLDQVDSLAGDILVVTETPDGMEHTTTIPVNEALTGHNKPVTVTESFRVPEGTPKGSTVNIYGNLVAKLRNGTEHQIVYPNMDDIGAIDNQFEEFFRFRIVR